MTSLVFRWGFEDIEEIYLKSTDVLQKFRRDISMGDFKWYRFRNAKQILFPPVNFSEF